MSKSRFDELSIDKKKLIKKIDDMYEKYIYAELYFDMANDYERLQNIRSAQREEIQYQREEIQDLKIELARLREISNIHQGIDMTYLETYGSFYEVVNGVLYCAPASNAEPPTFDMGDYGEVTAVDTVSEEHGKQFLKDINELFNTNFKLDDFAGR